MLHAVTRAGSPAATQATAHQPYNIRMLLPPEITGQKYLDLATLRKDGSAVHTPVWFGDKKDKLYVMTHHDYGKSDRLRNNPNARMASCTQHGKHTGPAIADAVHRTPPRA